MKLESDILKAEPNQETENEIILVRRRIEVKRKENKSQEGPEMKEKEELPPERPTVPMDLIMALKRGVLYELKAGRNLVEENSLSMT